MVDVHVHVQYASKKLNKSTVNGNGITARYHPKYPWSTSEILLGTSEVPRKYYWVLREYRWVPQVPLSYTRFYPCTGYCTCIYHVHVLAASDILATYSYVSSSASSLVQQETCDITLSLLHVPMNNKNRGRVGALALATLTLCTHAAKLPASKLQVVQRCNSVLAIAISSQIVLVGCLASDCPA